MKKLLLFFLLAAMLFSVGNVSAHALFLDTNPLSKDGLIQSRSNPVGSVTFRSSWFPLQFSILPQMNTPWLQLCAGNVEIPGVSLGLVMLQQQSGAVSFATLVNGQRKNYFLQTSPFVCVADDANYGIQAGFFNYSSPFMNNGHKAFWNEIQAGVFNFGGSIEIGVVNKIDGQRTGLQVGLINGADLYEGKTSSVQVGLWNMNGIFQIGLVNYNKNALVPWFPVLNFSWPWKTEKQ